MATEPIAGRISDIRRHKPSNEIETRLRCLKPVKGTLPGEVIEAFRFHTSVMEYQDKMWKFHLSMEKKQRRPMSCWLCEILCELRDQIDEDFWVILQKYESEINRLHGEECSCPWNGMTLFPGG